MNNFINNHLKQLEENHFDYPNIELRALLNKTSKSKKEIFFRNFNLNQIDLNLFRRAFKRRMKKEPLAKIFNEKYFWKYLFYVNKNVLDPRPETELLVETIEKYFKDKKQKLKIVDLGTGTGCLAISLAQEFINSRITATDISKLALKVAKINSIKYKTCNKIKFICCDWINTKNIFDIVVANPPYLTNNQYNNLNKEIKFYEPKIALIGGNDGLSCYRKLAYKISKIIHFNSLCFVEIGYNQKKACINIFAEFGLQCVDSIKDYQQYERILVLKQYSK